MDDDESNARTNHQKATLRKIIIAVLIVALVGLAAVIWLAWHKSIPAVQSYNDCVRAGYLKKGSPLCMTPNGELYGPPSASASVQ